MSFFGKEISIVEDLLWPSVGKNPTGNTKVVGTLGHSKYFLDRTLG